MIPSFIPGGVIWVYVTGIAMILGAIGLYIKQYRKMGASRISRPFGYFHSDNASFPESSRKEWPEWVS